MVQSEQSRKDAIDWDRKENRKVRLRNKVKKDIRELGKEPQMTDEQIQKMKEEKLKKEKQQAAGKSNADNARNEPPNGQVEKSSRMDRQSSLDQIDSYQMVNNHQLGE